MGNSSRCLHHETRVRSECEREIFSYANDTRPVDPHPWSLSDLEWVSTHMLASEHEFTSTGTIWSLEGTLNTRNDRLVSGTRECKSASCRSVGELNSKWEISTHTLGAKWKGNLQYVTDSFDISVYKKESQLRMTVCEKKWHQARCFCVCVSLWLG